MFTVIILSVLVLIAAVVVGVYSCFYWLFTGKSGIQFYTNFFINIQSRFLK